MKKKKLVPHLALPEVVNISNQYIKGQPQQTRSIVDE